MANSLSSIISRAQAIRGDSTPVSYSETVVLLENIGTRLAEDTRSLNQAHVERLAESIGAIGLIEPLVLDTQRRLLAGGHRRAAIYHLKEIAPAIFAEQFPGEKIPARIMQFDSEDEPDLALKVEVAENEQRRDYTPAEIRVVAEKLKQAGYKATAGRPKKGEKALNPALAVIFGKSLRTVERYLTKVEEPDREIPPSVGVSRKPLLQKALTSLQRWETLCESPGAEPGAEEEALLKKLPAFIKSIEKALKTIDS